MNLIHLRYFVELSRTGSYTQAAKRLCITQPSLRHAMAQLEEELLEEINALGIGPQGFGGRPPCLGLSIETAPTHVAGLPVAVYVSCHVTRRASAQL